MEDYLNLLFRTVLRSQTGADYSCLQRLGVGGSAETYLVLAVSGPLRGQLFAAKEFRRLSKPEPIVLRPISVDGGLGEPITQLIQPMLHADPSRRPSAAQSLPQWQELFLEAAKRAHALEGRVV